MKMILNSDPSLDKEEPCRCQLRVSGRDVQSFLQGQLSNDIDKIKDGQWQLNAYCQHQGRVIALLWVGKQEDDFYLALPMGGLQDVVQKRLQMFALNTDVHIESLTKIDKEEPCHWQEYPQIFLVTSEKFIPQDLNLDIDEVGVNFSKGCYPGQEVVARVHYLGKPKRRLYRFECDFEVMPLDKLTASDSAKVIGIVVNSAEFYFFATLKVAEQASAIFINKKPVKLLELATFST